MGYHEDASPSPPPDGDPEVAVGSAQNTNTETADDAAPLSQPTADSEGLASASTPSATVASSPGADTAADGDLEAVPLSLPLRTL